MKVIAGGKSSGGGAFLGEVLPQSFWSWLFVYMRFTLFGDKESPENSQVNDTTTQGPDDVQVGLLDEAHPKTRRQQMMTPTGTWCW